MGKTPRPEKIFPSRRDGIWNLSKCLVHRKIKSLDPVVTTPIIYADIYMFTAERKNSQTTPIIIFNVIAKIAKRCPHISQSCETSNGQRSPNMLPEFKLRCRHIHIAEPAIIITTHDHVAPHYRQLPERQGACIHVYIALERKH